MPIIKERRKINHEPSTHEIFTCLSQLPSYSKILLDNKPDKPYIDFLRWLLEVNFYKGTEEKITIKKLATSFKTETTKATKWISAIYNDIFEINWDKPELFQCQGTKVTLYMSHNDDRCSFCTTMPIVPREFEIVTFYFAKAKMGIDFFWVKKVEHEIGNDYTEVTIWLEGGFLNKYREFALHKALFQGWIGFMDEFNKHSFELDEELNKLYK